MGLSRNLACISPRVPSRRIQFVVKTKVFFACRFRFPASPMCKLVWNLKRMALEDDIYVAFHFTKKSTGTFPAMRCGCQGEVAGGCQSQCQRQEQQGLDSAIRGDAGRERLYLYAESRILYRQTEDYPLIGRRGRGADTENPWEKCSVPPRWILMTSLGQSSRFVIGQKL